MAPCRNLPQTAHQSFFYSELIPAHPFTI
jgi:hypothetical protein